MLFFLVLVLFAIQGNGQTISSTSAQGAGSTSSSTFSDVAGASVTLDVTDVDNVLLVSSFQLEMTAPESSERAASIRIVDAADPSNINSGNIVRSLSNAKSTDYGIGSLVHIFDVSSYSGNRTYKLQHAFDNVSRTLNTNATLVGLVLKSGTDQMVNSSAQISSPVGMTDSWTGVTGLETSALGTTVYGGFYVAASIESLTTSFNTTSLAEWKLQYKKGVAGTWTDISPVAERSMSNTSDIGIVSLVGIVDNSSSPGDYYFRVAHRRASATSVIQTNAGHLVALSLGAGSVYYPVIKEEVSSVQTSSSTYSNAAVKAITPDVNTNLFIHAQYCMSADAELNSPKFDLYVDNSVLDSYDMLRYLRSATVTGCGANVALATGLSSGVSYNVSLRHASVSPNTLTTSGIMLGGFYLVDP